MASSEHLEAALQALHYIFPLTFLGYYLIATGISFCTLQALKSGHRQAPRKPWVILQGFVFVLYLVEAVMLLMNTVLQDADSPTKDTNVSSFLEVLNWLILNVSLLESKRPTWYVYYGSWILALIADAAFFGFAFNGLGPKAFDVVKLIVQALRLTALVLLLLAFFFLRHSTEQGTDEETTSLISKRDHKASYLGKSSDQWASASSNDSDLTDSENDAVENKKDRDKKRDFKRKLRETGNFVTYLRRFSIFVPLVWPSTPGLCLNMLGIGLCLIGERFMNLLIPIQLGLVVDSLVGQDGQGRFPVLPFVLFILYPFVDQVIDYVRQYLVNPIENNARRSIKTVAHAKILDLSRDFHTNKASGEMYKAVEQGASVTALFELLVFDFIPILVDLFVAYFYLGYLFGPYMTLWVIATAVFYIWVSSHTTSLYTKPTRSYMTRWRRENQAMYESIGNWDTVSFFNRQDYEKKRLAGAVDLRLASYNTLYRIFCTVQPLKSILLQLGLAGSCSIAIYQIIHGSQAVGSFTMLVSYYAQFTSCLDYFTNAHKDIMENLIAAESLLDILHKEPTIRDGAGLFNFSNGAVDFKDIDFSYDGKKNIVQNFNFAVKPGSKVALVGETGGGKSTILRLLYRFYDVQKGSITIDGQDIRSVTLTSLRQCMGVVPQDPSLFNVTLMENVRYAKLDATDEEVIKACEAAAIHDKIQSFTKGYATKVGEHGVKLSGGELQRIAIARVVLKSPDIVLLDEATSAVDSETEALIQKALEKLTSGRTTFVIAHRLSTIMSADVILVIKSGAVVEHGSPHELLKRKEIFYDLWSKQVGVFKDIDDTIEGDRNQNRGKKLTRRSNSTFSSTGRSFRPDAPVFVPRSQHESTASQDSATPCEESNPSSSRNKENLKSKGKIDRLSRMGIHGNKSGDSESDPAMETLPTKALSNATNLQFEEEPPVPDKKGKATHSNRHQRRRLGRSDPSGTTSGNSQGDANGKNATSYAADQRRVSAPGKAPSGATNTPAPSPARKPRRRLRIRKRAPTTTGSGTLVAESSTAQSSEMPQTSKMGTSMNTQDMGTKSSSIPTILVNSVPANNAAAGVHFAPDV